MISLFTNAIAIINITLLLGLLLVVLLLSHAKLAIYCK